MKSNCTYTIVTTSNIVKNDGSLVMGKGAASSFRNKYPESAVFGSLVTKQIDSSGYYGLILYKNLGIFQVKYHWKDPADLELIRRSTYELTRFAKSHRDWTFAMNFPGIGAGQLDYEDVLAIVSKLPDNVYLYIKE